MNIPWFFMIFRAVKTKRKLNRNDNPVCDKNDSSATGIPGEAKAQILVLSLNKARVMSLQSPRETSKVGRT